VIVDRLTSEVRYAQIFVAVIGASNFIYGEVNGPKSSAIGSGPRTRAFAMIEGEELLRAGAIHRHQICGPEYRAESFSRVVPQFGFSVSISSVARLHKYTMKVVKFNLNSAAERSIHAIALSSLGDSEESSTLKRSPEAAIFLCYSIA
jgi:hypothetical protein